MPGEITLSTWLSRVECLHANGQDVSGEIPALIGLVRQGNDLAEGLRSSVQPVVLSGWDRVANAILEARASQTSSVGRAVLPGHTGGPPILSKAHRQPPLAGRPEAAGEGA